MFGFSRITDTPTGDVQRGNTHSRPVQAARPRLVEGGLTHAVLKAHGACGGGEGGGINAHVTTAEKICGGGQPSGNQEASSFKAGLIVSEELMTSAEIKTRVVQSAKYDAEVNPAELGT